MPPNLSRGNTDQSGGDSSLWCTSPGGHAPHRSPASVCREWWTAFRERGNTGTGPRRTFCNSPSNPASAARPSESRNDPQFSTAFPLGKWFRRTHVDRTLLFFRRRSRLRCKSVRAEEIVLRPRRPGESPHGVFSGEPQGSPEHARVDSAKPVELACAQVPAQVPASTGARSWQSRRM
jgi:hypothetical protein